MWNTGRVQREAAGNVEMGQLDMRQGQLTVSKEALDAVQCIADMRLGLVDRPGDGIFDAVPYGGGCTLDAVKH